MPSSTDVVAAAFRAAPHPPSSLREAVDLSPHKGGEVSCRLGLDGPGTCSGRRAANSKKPKYLLTILKNGIIRQIVQSA
jgi:hypothetical protein